MRRLVLASLLVFALAPTAGAANQGVTVSSAGYAPQTVTVYLGETVTWTWDATGTGKTVTSDTGLFDSGVRAAGDSFSYTFHSKGTFGYHDSSPCLSGCTGTVIVANRPPVASGVATPNPAQVGAVVKLDGSGSYDPDGTIVHYEWDLNGDGTYETDGGGSPQASTVYPNPGVVAVGLRVTDDNGATATTQIPLTVIPVPTGPLPPRLETGIVAARMLARRAVAQSGVNAVVSCSAPCQAVLRLVPRGGAARAAATRPLGTITARLPLAGRALVTVPIRPDLRAGVAASGRRSLSLRASITDALGRLTQRSRKITLVPVKLYGVEPAIGISDQDASTFSDPRFRVLRLRYARYVIPWNAIFTEPHRIASWLRAARRAGAEPFVAFQHARGDHCPQRPCRAPSVKRYLKAFRAFRRHHRSVKVITPWNEENDPAEPTYKRPRLAARYYNAARRACRSCTLTAADVLDLHNLGRWLRTFRRYAHGRPRLWGLHNYRDTNRFRSSGTRTMLRLVRGKVWVTETGGIVYFRTYKGEVRLPRSERRAARAMKQSFRLAELHSRRITRVYIYQWKLNFHGDRFDAGVIRPSGRPRRSYDVLSEHAGLVGQRP